MQKEIKEKKKELVINDIPFRSYFGKEENKEILSLLISEIMEVEYKYVLKNIKYLNPELERININDKGNITDILVEVGKYVIDIEAYTNYQKKHKLKNLVYLTKIINNYYNDKNEYKAKKEIIQINIIKRKEKDAEYYVQSKEKKYVEEIKIIEIYIDKEETLLYTKSELTNKELWKLLFGCEIKDTKRISFIIEKMKYDEKIKEKFKGGIIKHMTLEYLKEIGTTWEDRLNLEIAIAKEKATKEGLKYGKKLGIEKGIEKGMKKVIEKGMISKSIDIASKLIYKNISFKEISEITGLSIDKIEGLSEKTYSKI